MPLRDFIDQLRREIYDRLNELSSLVDAHFSRLSEIERETEAEADRYKVWDMLREVAGLKVELARLRADAKLEIKQKLADAKAKLKQSIGSLPEEELEALRDRLDDIRDMIEDQLDSLDDKIDSFIDRVEDAQDKIRDRIKEMKRPRRGVLIDIAGPEIRIPEIRIPEIKIPDVGDLIEKSLSSAWTRGPSTIISSVRLPEADIDLIDALVMAGIFKSRNEGIAYFAHKGIEGSKEWLTGIKEKLDQIRKLQEETKRDLDKMMGGSVSDTSGEEKED